MMHDKHDDPERLDVAAILEGLRAEVRARRLGQEQAEQTPVERELERTLDEIELYRVISAHWPLVGKSVLQRAINLVNKLVRRYLRWYINPIVEQQNAYNDAVARALRLLAEAYDDLARQMHAITPQARTGGQESGDGSGATGTRNQADLHPANEPASDTAGRGAHYTELLALVRERAAQEPPAHFPDLALQALEPQLHLRQEVLAHWPLEGRSLAQRGVALVNKLVRRYLRWYINPIVEQQNAANTAFTAVLLNLIRLDAARRAEVARSRARGRSSKF